MKTQRVLITDLDGTLLKNSMDIADKDRAFIRSVTNSMYFGIATGRSIKEINYVESCLGISANVRIGFNGGIIELDEQRIFEKSLDEEDLCQLFQFIHGHQLVFDAHDGEKRFGNYVPKDKKTLWNIKEISKDFAYATLKTKKLYKVNIRPRESEQNHLLEKLQVAFPHLSICCSGKRRIEVTPPNVSKGNALTILRQQGACNIFVVGDSENDVSMFELADKSFCMMNGTPDVKKHADFILNNVYELSEFL